jgi:spoIIIJ-associated protein
LVTDDQGSNPRLEEPAKEGRAQGVERFCRELVGASRLELVVTVSEQEETVHVNFTGHDRPLLLSNTAALLNSIEYLVNKAFRAAETETPSIMVDSDRYRQHREAELVLLAKMASQKVLEQRRPLTLQPMVPRERRIVHLTLATIEGVHSQSDGEGEDRSITIYPE